MSSHHLRPDSSSDSNNIDSTSVDVSAQETTSEPEVKDSHVEQIYGLRDSRSHRRRRRKRRSSSRRKNRTRAVVGIIAVVLFLVLCIVAVWLASLAKSMGLGDERSSALSALVTENQATEESQNNGYYVLLVGSDARENDTFSRGDVLMLARVDPVEHMVTLVSIPRDTMVRIEGAIGTQKINAAYAYGGASTAIYEVSRFAGVPISHYVEIDFTGLEGVVNMLGGVTIDVPEDISLGDKTLTAGQQTLDGETALAYARERYNATGGDFGRARAQRLIVQAIIKQVMAAPATELPGLLKELARCVSTDYGMADLLNLALQFYAKTITVYSAVCPSYALWQDGVSYVGTMFDEWRDMMRRVDAGMDPNDTSVPIPEPQASNNKLGSAVNSEAPTDYHDLAENAMTTDVVAKTDSVATIN